MSEDEARQTTIRYLLEKADNALLAAQREYSAGDLDFAINRVYYACFYAASAVLLNEKQQFTKHTGVRTAVHMHLVKAGKLSPEMGKFYDEAFKERHEADYTLPSEFDPKTTANRIEQASAFVTEMKRLSN